MGNKALSTVAHNIMVHYAEKELIKKHKKKYKMGNALWMVVSGNS
jgi:hypothetical protein